jgi:AmpE protein
MRFLIIVLVLLSDRYMIHHMQKIRRTWLESYTEFLKNLIPQSLINSHPLSLYFLVLGSLIAFCLLFEATQSMSLFFILYFIFEFVVFYVCLGEHNLFYFNTNQKDHLNKKEYIIAINQEIFAIIIWFFAFGPVGAILYRVTLNFAKIPGIDKSIHVLNDIFDWLPTRLTALLFLLVGQFQPGFSEYIQHILSKPEHNNTMLLSMAEHALDCKSMEKLTISKLENLFTHACLLLLFILAVFMIGKLL